MSETKGTLKHTPENSTISLKVRTGLQAGTYWNYVSGLSRKNTPTYCPMACTAGWEGTTRNMTKSGGECGCAG